MMPKIKETNVRYFDVDLVLKDAMKYAAMNRCTIYDIYKKNNLSNSAIRSTINTFNDWVVRNDYNPDDFIDASIGRTSADNLSRICKAFKLTDLDKYVIEYEELFKDSNQYEVPIEQCDYEIEVLDKLEEIRNALIFSWDEQKKQTELLTALLEKWK